MRSRRVRRCPVFPCADKCPGQQLIVARWSTTQSGGRIIEINFWQWQSQDTYQAVHQSQVGIAQKIKVAAPEEAELSQKKKE